MFFIVYFILLKLAIPITIEYSLPEKKYIFAFCTLLFLANLLKSIL